MVDCISRFCIYYIHISLHIHIDNYRLYPVYSRAAGSARLKLRGKPKPAPPPPEDIFGGIRGKAGFMF